MVSSKRHCKSLYLFCNVSVDRTGVILVAQVFNGCLLPFFSTCLLLCLNDQQFMRTSPQPLWANLFLVTSVIITMFLANNAIIQKIYLKDCTYKAQPFYAIKLNMANTLVLTNKQWFTWLMDN